MRNYTNFIVIIVVKEVMFSSVSVCLLLGERAEELLVSQWPSISRAQLCLWTSSCSWVTSY